MRLLTRPDIAFIITRRKPIDRYISSLKARALGKWRFADTTNVEVRGDVRQFLDEWNRFARWYASCREVIESAGRPQTDLSYAGDISQPNEVLRHSLREKLQEIGVDPGNFTAPIDRPLERQDRASLYEEKMANWPQFLAELRKHPQYFAAFVE